MSRASEGKSFKIADEYLAQAVSRETWLVKAEVSKVTVSRETA